ncbi:hypothetical protein GA0115253_103907 [Streptomyces sp. Termitarium-T10T-6]|nr:hypothetical protein GA0115253_103907 [Streptomyces sp. Termitarium-T10T-6]
MAFGLPGCVRDGLAFSAARRAIELNPPVF